jgi:hypothetical protein
MKCFDCNHINERGSKFCSNCGKDFKAKKNNNHNYSAYPDANAVTMHADKLKERANDPFKIIVFYLVVLIVSFFICGGSLLGLAIVGFFASMFAINAFFTTRVVLEQFYYTLPSSRDLNGEHRCIFCGNKGIHKSTIYRTSTTVNTCTKCRKELFRN